MASETDTRLAETTIAGPRTHVVAASAEILPYPAARGGAAQRLVRRLLRWYLWPVTASMSGHNQAVAKVLAENERQLALAGFDHERTARQLDLLQRTRHGTDAAAAE